MNEHILLISDLHLQANEAKTAQAFLHFLAHDATKAKALYILGDFFEVWIGDDVMTSFEKQIVEALRHASQSGLSIYLLPGNRDFLIGRQFAEQAGIKLLPDPVCIQLFADKVLLAHGDQLCTDDKHHQWFRQFSHHPYVKKLFLWLPENLRRSIAQRIRDKSKQSNQHKSQQIMDVTESSVIATMEKYSVTKLIHGHTHRPALHHHQLNNELGQRYVLGDWHDTAKILQVNSDCSYQLKTLNLS